MARRRSGYIEIDVCELLDEVDDDTLLDAVADRKLVVPSTVPNEPTDMDMVREAYWAVQRGYTTHGALLAFMPKHPENVVLKAAKSLADLYQKIGTAHL